VDKIIKNPNLISSKFLLGVLIILFSTILTFIKILPPSIYMTIVLGIYGGYSVANISEKKKKEENNVKEIVRSLN